MERTQLGGSEAAEPGHRPVRHRADHGLVHLAACVRRGRGLRRQHRPRQRAGGTLERQEVDSPASDTPLRSFPLKAWWGRVRRAHGLRGGRLLLPERHRWSFGFRREVERTQLDAADDPLADRCAAGAPDRRGVHIRNGLHIGRGVHQRPRRRGDLGREIQRHDVADPVDANATWCAAEPVNAAACTSATSCEAVGGSTTAAGSQPLAERYS